jgi:hypothetical protein
MDKRRLHHYWRRFRAVKSRYFFLAAAICSVGCVVALRANNEHMATLRQAVYTADKNDGDVQTALNDLQKYVTTHMNTSLSAGNTAVYPPIQLQYTYERLENARLQAVQAANGDLYTRAQIYCQKLNSTDFSGHNRVPCIEQYVKDHGAVAPAAIPTSLYQFDFVSPSWSPDVAGWLLAATIVLLLTGIVTFLINRHLRRLL